MNQGQAAADFILNKLPEPPYSAVILGSGLGHFSTKLKDPIQIPYSNILQYSNSSVSGHAGEWIFGYIDEKPIICASGRFHYYEGYSMEEVALHVSVANLLGCRLLIITNSAGCLKKKWKLGQLMLITGYLDYIILKRLITLSVSCCPRNNKDHIS